LYQLGGFLRVPRKRVRRMEHEIASGCNGVSDVVCSDKGLLTQLSNVNDASDPRVAIYRNRARRDHREYQTQVRILADRAQTQRGLSPHPQAHGKQRELPLRKLESVVGVHYSWDCLRRLHQAQQAGHSILVDSILIPTCTAEHLVELAASIAPSVFVADPALIDQEFAFEGSNERGQCKYVVAFPIPRPISELQAPLVILDDLGSAQNIGQILRTAYHFGITSIVATQSSWNCLTGRACRVSMGWLYFMDFHLTDALPSALETLRKSGVRIYAAEDYFATPVAPHEPAGDRSWALILGREDKGVSPAAIAASDTCVCVPQRQGESLNVAHAASICLYELSKHMGK